MTNGFQYAIIKTLSYRYDTLIAFVVYINLSFVSSDDSLFESKNEFSITIMEDIMGRNAKTTEFLKECMADALIMLMKKKSVEKISAQEITDLAGVGRATWFRNFSSKNDALSFKLVKLWERWMSEHHPEGASLTKASSYDFFHFNSPFRCKNSKKAHIFQEKDFIE